MQIELYDISGRFIRSILNETKTKGKHQVSFSSENLASGIYFYELKTDEVSVSKRMIILE